MDPEKSVIVGAGATKSSSVSLVIRVATAIAIVVGVTTYIRSILIGAIPPVKKLGAVELTIILVAALIVSVLLHPEFLDRLTHFKLGSLEFELEKLQHAQQVQRNELDDLRFVLTLLLQPSELQHLKNLEKGDARNCIGSHTLRTELRKLRAMELIRSCNNKKIAEMTDQQNWDLASFVELTKRGSHYLERLGEEK